jgi:hypothetical protein
MLPGDQLSVKEVFTALAAHMPTSGWNPRHIPGKVGEGGS